ncbi:Os01g0784833 [Oryza sativa Japonica Group]|uniref:Os01g0784833 protein n=1 Tax=Oryza sativa subsp. japonica TaxID=39947 RepID=A0A0P0V908_ORYSJ|nr:hypothetical protein EE612_006147 [Oryza sativa]BAS74683.1 Os01g0784833 [Oryza sativa Japonica Group]
MEISSGPLELLRDACEVLPLVEGVLQLHFRRPPRAVGGKGAGAVRAAPLNFSHVKHLGTEGVPDRDEHHAVVSQLKLHLRCSLLTTALGTSAEEDAGGLACKALLTPQATGCIKECFHLRSHHAKPCREPKQDSISLSKFLWCDRWHIWLRRRAHLSKYFLMESFRNLPYFSLNTFNR